MAKDSGPNPLGLQGIEMVEFSGPDPAALERLFRAFGFAKVARHEARDVSHFRQNDIHFLVSGEAGSFAAAFARRHGPCIAAMAWRVDDAERALALAVERGARRADTGDYRLGGKPVPAIYGIGESLIYLVDGPEDGSLYTRLGFVPLAEPEAVPDKGFLAIDHLTNNVPKGTLRHWADFYKTVFGFTDVRYFDIRGVKTGLTSYALRSPCGTFSIPINEGTEATSQIDEYLREYGGPGVQHLALSTGDIVQSVRALQGSGVQTLAIDDEYYAEVFTRVPGVVEDQAALRALQILVDGDEEGYLLQIFTKNVIGPIFIEVIQRRNHHSFGEGNFGALFRSIERDQETRGVL